MAANPMKIAPVPMNFAVLNLMSCRRKSTTPVSGSASIDAMDVKSGETMPTQRAKDRLVPTTKKLFSKKSESCL